MSPTLYSFDATAESNAAGSSTYLGTITASVVEPTGNGISVGALALLAAHPVVCNALCAACTTTRGRATDTTAGLPPAPPLERPIAVNVRVLVGTVAACTGRAVAAALAMFPRTIPLASIVGRAGSDVWTLDKNTPNCRRNSGVCV